MDACTGESQALQDVLEGGGGRLVHSEFKECQNWRAKPLVSYRVIVELISATTTKTGLTVRCELDTAQYPVTSSSPMCRWRPSTSNAPRFTVTGITPSRQIPILQIAPLFPDESLRTPVGERLAALRLHQADLGFCERVAKILASALTTPPNDLSDAL